MFRDNNIAASDQAAPNHLVSVSVSHHSDTLATRHAEDVFCDEEEAPPPPTTTTTTATTTTTQTQTQTEQSPSFLETDCGSMTVRALVGLGIAGLGGTLVADVFGMFYVDCFLRAYRLPMRVFGIGSAIFAVINTANDVAGAYLLDWYCAGATTTTTNRATSRGDLVGLSGCLYALSVLTPFFRWGPRTEASASKTAGMVWDGLHFVGSLSIYDTMFSFNCILQGSIVSDNHSMSESQRIWFFALKDMVGIVAPLVVTKIGLSLFRVNDLTYFRCYVLVLVVVSSGLAGWGQALIHHGGQSTLPARQLLPAFLGGSNKYTRVNRESGWDETNTATATCGDESTSFENDNSNANSNDNSNDNSESESDSDHHEKHYSAVDTDGGNSGENKNSTLAFWRVVSDFAGHPNFRYWIGMEMLMEGQNTFLGNFQKTFVDQLLRSSNGTGENFEGGGWSDQACDWMLALLDPATQIVGLLLFLPIRRYGYAVLYKVVFCSNILMATGLLLSNGLDNDDDDDDDGNHHKTLAIAAFLCGSIVLSNAMAGAGFGLAMCDMVLEMKHSHSVVQGRKNPPSLAGLFMGVNALFCKPAESVLPILAASFLGEAYNNNNSNDDSNSTSNGNGNGNGDDNATNTSSGISQDARIVLYRLLVFPPLVCSILQLALWSRYSLVPEKTERLRAELKEHEQQQQQRQRHQQDEFHENTDTHSLIEMNQLT